jgi:8-oxo-dGTP pyrophosphatase MutT (NUDIX family)/N-acetylglutamate synthase-like GNAT family acetyltransferase
MKLVESKEDPFMTDFASRYRVISAVYVIFRDHDDVLLLRRAGTGYHDGEYSVPAGHIDGGEPATLAAVREAKEEAAVDINPRTLRLAHTMHRVSTEPELHERIDLFFEASEWTGEPTNAEPYKCDELRWTSLNNLPENMVPEVAAALRNIAIGEPYSEFKLWEAAFGEAWPLYPAAFYATIDSLAAHNVVAESDGTLAGLAAGSWDGRHRASILAVVVRPEHHDEGIESMLLESATQHFKALGVTTLRFGGGQSYFWPGIPTDQRHILQLLEQNGWLAGRQITDMVGDIETSHVPGELIDRIARSGAHLRLATAEDGPAILAFEEEHFPEWLLTAAIRVEHENFANILLAELDGMVVGTNFLTPPGDPSFL